jgi:tRNA pseudouridine55 synthase
VFGFININKPKYRTSRESVNAVQNLVRPHRVGHCGTLDPLATGVLLIGVGPATRLTRYVHDMPKTYLADFRLGFVSDTEDVSGTIEAVPNAESISETRLAELLPEFVGELMQQPPRFSAIRVGGRRAYHLARKGKDVELEPRPILIHEISLTQFQFPDFQIEVRCGSGTYIRSLGRDIGRALGSGAIMTGLVRTSIGNFDVRHGISSDDLTLEMVREHLVQPHMALEGIPKFTVPDSQVDKFVDGVAWTTETPVDSEEAAAVDESGRLLAVLRKRSPSLFTPYTNFSHYWIEQARNVGG